MAKKNESSAKPILDENNPKGRANSEDTPLTNQSPEIKDVEITNRPPKLGTYITCSQKPIASTPPHFWPEKDSDDE